MSEGDEHDERKLRMKLMGVDIQCKLQEIKMENRKFTVQAILAAAALVAAGVALGKFVVFHQ
jgi:hypothetical protein